MVFAVAGVVDAFAVFAGWEGFAEDAVFEADGLAEEDCEDFAVPVLCPRFPTKYSGSMLPAELECGTDGFLSFVSKAAVASFPQ